MGASFRSTGQVEALAGCDRLTISPSTWKSWHLTRVRWNETAPASGLNHRTQSHRAIRVAISLVLNANAMAHDKLSEGIRIFAADQEKLEGKELR